MNSKLKLKNSIAGYLILTIAAIATLNWGCSNGGSSAATVTSSVKRVLVDSDNHRILLFEGTDELTSSSTPDVVLGQPDFTSNSSGIAANALNAPFGAYWDGTHLFVLDGNNPRVLIWNSWPTSNQQAADVVVGQVDFTSNSSGTTASTLNSTNSVYSNGTKLFIGDCGNSRVLVFNTIPTSNGASADVVIGQANMTSGALSTTASGLNCPAGITSDGTRLFVNDSQNRRMLIYNTIPTSNGASADVVVGQVDFTSNSSGTTASTFGSPWDISVSTDGKLAISDWSNNRVLIWNSIPTSNGAAADVVVGQANMTTGTANGGGVPSASVIDGASGVRFLGSKFYMSDYSNHRVLYWDSVPTTNGASADGVFGQPDFTSNASGTTQSTLTGPYGLY